MPGAFEEYTDAFGLIQNAPVNGARDQSSGNGLLFTGEAVVAMQYAGMLDPEYDFESYAKVRGSILMGIRACEVQRGLWLRHPVNYTKDIEGPDDHFGIAALSRILDLPFAREFLEYGRRSHDRWGPFNLSFVFNNQNPEHLDPEGEAWLGRFPALICAMEWAAGEHPPLWRRLYLAISVALVGFSKKEDLDARTLSWCAIAAAGRQCFLVNMAEKLWLRSLRRTYPGGMKEVFAKYFGSDHPLAKYSEDSQIDFR